MAPQVICLATVCKWEFVKNYTNGRLNNLRQSLLKLCCYLVNNEGVFEFPVCYSFKRDPSETDEVMPKLFINVNNAKYSFESSSAFFHI